MFENIFRTTVSSSKNKTDSKIKKGSKKHKTQKNRPSPIIRRGRKSLHGGVRNDDEIFEYWYPFFINYPAKYQPPTGNFKSGTKKNWAIGNIILFKQSFIQTIMLNPNPAVVVDFIKHIVPTFAVNDASRLYTKILCDIFLLIGFLTHILWQFEHKLLMKGGKAVQLALAILVKHNPVAKQYVQNNNKFVPYESNDIDVLIIPKPDNTKTVAYQKKQARDMALKIGDFIEWITMTNVTNYSLLDIARHSVNDPTELDSSSIVKVALIIPKNNGGRPDHFAVADIGYILPEYSDLFNSTIDAKTFMFGLLPGMFMSVSIDGLILEKIHYIAKYIHSNESNNIRFRSSLKRSLNALLDDLTQNYQPKPIPNNTNSEQLVKVIDKRDILQYYIEREYLIYFAFPNDTNQEEIITFILSP